MPFTASLAKIKFRSIISLESANNRAESYGEPYEENRYSTILDMDNMQFGVFDMNMGMEENLEGCDNILRSIEIIPDGPPEKIGVLYSLEVEEWDESVLKLNIDVEDDEVTDSEAYFTTKYLQPKQSKYALFDPKLKAFHNEFQLNSRTNDIDTFPELPESGSYETIIDVNVLESVTNNNLPLEGKTDGHTPSPSHNTPTVNIVTTEDPFLDAILRNAKAITDNSKGFINQQIVFPNEASLKGDLSVPIPAISNQIHHANPSIIESVDSKILPCDDDNDDSQENKRRINIDNDDSNTDENIPIQAKSMGSSREVETVSVQDIKSVLSTTPLALLRLLSLGLVLKTPWDISQLQVGDGSSVQYLRIVIQLLLGSYVLLCVKDSEKRV